MVRPLGAHEFDSVVASRVDFDPQGLVIAERDGQIVGFAHAGFGPAEPHGPTHRLDRMLGTVAMLVVDPAVEAADVPAQLLRSAEGYLAERGARVIYAGGRFPLDPFYRAIYGGSEWSGILDGHPGFCRAVEAAGYDVAARAIALELDLASPEVRDPKAAIHRRQVRVDRVEDADVTGWWNLLGLGMATTDRFRLIGKRDEAEIARATLWDMAPFGRSDGRARVGLCGVEVAPVHRRQGYGRHLITEILRQVRGQWGEVVQVACDETNIPALALYAAVGFEPVGLATLYRKPGP